jgi:hypothetical protein
MKKNIRKRISEVLIVPVPLDFQSKKVADLPAFCLIRSVAMVRTVAWSDVASTLKVGTGSGGEDLMTASEARIATAIPGGNDAGVEVVGVYVYKSEKSRIFVTLDPGTSTVGEGYLAIEYVLL